MLKKIIEFIALRQKILTVLVAIFAVLFPFLFKNAYVMRMATISLMYIMLAMGINLIMGYMGQMTFSHAAFWGMGAYTAGILSTRYGSNYIFDVIAGMIVAGFFAFLLGLSVLKVKGYYLTIVTLGFGEIVRLVELNQAELTGGAMGIKGIPGICLFGKETYTNSAFYFTILIMVVVTILVLVRINSSRYGVALKSIRDDDAAAEVMGINVVRNKILTFVLSAMIAGAAGAFYAHYVSYIDSTCFTTQASQEMCVMVILGGLGSIPGTILGATVLTVVPELIRDLMQYRMLIYGGIMVIMMLVCPQGLLGKIDFGLIRKRIVDQGSHGQKGESK